MIEAGTPLPPLARGDRLARLRGRLEELGLDGLVTVHGPSLRYLCGFSGSSGLLVVRGDDGVLLTDSRYEVQAADEVDRTIEVRIAGDGLFDALSELARDWPGSPRVAFEPAHVSVRDKARLERAAPEVDWTAREGLVESLRARKDVAEIARIRRAAVLACNALEETLGRVEEGISEAEITAELEYRLRRAGSDGPAFESIVAVGPRSALPHARPSARILREGDLLLLDFGAVVDGYRSDITRTVVAGAAAAWQLAVHRAVLAAHDAAVAAVAAGAPAADVDAAARASLTEAGYGEHFGHSTGHGLGLEVHEEPAVSRRSEAILQAGNVVTIEPGVYLPGRGGVRLEDDVWVEEAGARPLTDFPLDLREL